MSGTSRQSPPPAGGGLSRFRALHAGAFALLLVAWTWLLVEPQPVPDRVTGAISWFDREAAVFLVSKAVHVGVYAFLAAFGGLLSPARRWRWGVCAVLVLHGAATEVAQTYVPNRHGSVRDVLLDAAGVAAGAWAVRRRGG